MANPEPIANQAPHCESASALLPVVYQELRTLAANLLNREPPGHTLQPTALVHEAFLRVTGSSDIPRWENRGHFFAAAARAMRRILVDAARRKKAYRRIVAQNYMLTNDEHTPALDLIALDDALHLLADQDAIASRIVELKYFAGLTIEQAAEALEVSRYVVTQKWTYARAWLRLTLEGPPLRIVPK